MSHAWPPVNGLPMEYSRLAPSPRYTELVAMYRQLHEEGEKLLGIPPAETFNGHGLLLHSSRIKRLIESTGAASLLDYGSGKGRQYAMQNVNIPGDGVRESVQDYWNVDFVHCYDPAYPPFSKRPEGRFGGVIATDVLEHCPAEDMAWIIDDLFDYAELFVFAHIACYPAQKHLPNGENAHCTIKPEAWWQDLFRAAAARRQGVAWTIVLQG